MVRKNKQLGSDVSGDVPFTSGDRSIGHFSHLDEGRQSEHPVIPFFSRMWCNVMVAVEVI